MNNLIDFTNCEENLKTYNGANGSKLGIIFNGEDYLLKFPPKPTKKTDLSYSNSCFSECISCQILKTLGFKVQDTMLGTYKNKIVVACKDFVKPNWYLADFASFKNAIVDSRTNGVDTSIEEILDVIDNQEKFPIDNRELNNFFWKMFVADSLLGNFDRHNGNWGFLINNTTKECEIAPIYDCGSCLFPQADENMMKFVLANKDEIEKRVYTYPISALKLNNVKINPFDFLINTSDKNCIKALNEIQKKVDLEKINLVIDKTPYISDIHKTFVKTIIKERKERILDIAVQKHSDKNNEKIDLQSTESRKAFVEKTLAENKNSENDNFEQTYKKINKKGY